MIRRLLLQGGTVVDGSGRRPRRADVTIEAGRIVAVGADTERSPQDEVIECEGRLVLPGFIDAHSHADAAAFEPIAQHALLRQGVTTVIAGQDGVSFAPGDGTYATDYFHGLNGAHPTYAGGGVAELLRSYDGTTRLNVGYLVPAGTVRHEVMGMAARAPDCQEQRRMIDLVRAGLQDGALGLSSGLDYVPGCFADGQELADLCRPVAEVGGLYVTHMRGGYEENAPLGVGEVARICDETGVAAHISHLHARADLVAELFTGLADRGLDVTYDAYPYLRGCTLLAMPMLPPDLLALGTAAAAHRLRDPSERERLLQTWIPGVALRPDMGPRWTDNATLSHIAAQEYAWAEGLTLTEAGRRAGQDPAELGLTLLAESRLQTTAIFAVPRQRDDTDLAQLFSHPAHVGGSDGIFVGAHPHPRAAGTFARFVKVFVRERGDWSWEQAAHHLSGRTAERYGLGDRGRLAPGFAADAIVVDPASVSDRATYEQPSRMAVGIADVVVNGVTALRHGELTGLTPGAGLRRTAPSR